MVKVRALDPFKVLYKLGPDIHTVVLIGGRGGAKTYEASKFVAFSATVRKKRCVVLRDEKELIRESILNEVLLRYDTANAGGRLDTQFERLDTGIKDRESGEMVVFTKGFRASASAKRANLKSISNVDISIIEEAEDIRDEDKFNTFADSIRKPGSLIVIILNTPDLNHWISKRYFNSIHVEENFYRLVPKDIPGVLVIQTGFEDNPYLPEHIRQRYRDYGEPDSPYYNPFYYKTAILGLASTGRKGQVFTKVKPIKLSEYMALPYREYYGQDFGTASPAGLVGVKLHKNQVFVRELLYKPMNTLDLAVKYCELGFGPADLIVADYADAKAMTRLKNGYKATDLPAEMFEKYPGLARGFNVVPAYKGKVIDRIRAMDEMEIYAVEESSNLWSEFQNYVFAQDKNGNYTDEPIDDFNHVIDPLGYVVFTIRRPASTGSTAGRRA